MKGPAFLIGETITVPSNIGRQLCKDFETEHLSLFSNSFRRLVGSKLEEALTNNLQEFLLELREDFAFVARQKRLTLDAEIYVR